MVSKAEITMKSIQMTLVRANSIKFQFKAEFQSNLQ